MATEPNQATSTSQTKLTLTLTLTLALTLLNPNICAHIVGTHNNFFPNL